MTETYEGWTALELSFPSDVPEDDPRLDVLSAALFELGAAGLETKERGGGVLIVASFAPDVGDEALAAIAQEALEVSELEGAPWTTSKYAPIDWSTHWRQHFHSIRFAAGERHLWVVPTWLTPPEGAAHVLRIDPSSAFGTGLHATTAMCLEKLVALAPSGSVLDVGTGTGILALAALELGAARAVATDNDPEALRVAAENAERNGFASPRLTISPADPGALGEQFDVVVANILARPLIELASEVAKAARPGATVILSGITRAQVDDVIRAYEGEGLQAAAVEARDEWARVDFIAGP